MAVVVHVSGAFALAAMVAMPEKHHPVWVPPPEDEFVRHLESSGCSAGAARARARDEVSTIRSNATRAGYRVLHRSALREPRSADRVYGLRMPRHVSEKFTDRAYYPERTRILLKTWFHEGYGGWYEYRYRDAGPHVPFDGFWKWLTL